MIVSIICAMRIESTYGKTAGLFCQAAKRLGEALWSASPKYVIIML